MDPFYRIMCFVAAAISALCAALAGGIFVGLSVFFGLAVLIGAIETAAVAIIKAIVSK